MVIDASTGKTVAANPKTDGTDKSTNSPTTIMTSSAIDMKTSRCPVKMGWNVARLKKRSGSAAV